MALALGVNLVALAVMGRAIEAADFIETAAPDVVTIDLVSVVTEETTPKPVPTPAPTPTSRPPPDREAARAPRTPERETSAETIARRNTAPQAEQPLAEAPPETESPEKLLESLKGAPPASMVEIAPEWRIDPDSATLEELGDQAFADRPAAGSGDDGADDRMRRALNAAACEDIQLAARLGRNCPAAGAYMRYADKDWAERDLGVYRDTFGAPGPTQIAGPDPGSLSRDGVLPQAVADSWEPTRDNASSGMVGQLPDPHPQPEYSWTPAR